jgi:hypothetical protein
LIEFAPPRQLNRYAPDLITMDWKTTITLLVTVALALVGYLIKYLNDLVIVRRKDRLERINLQLKNLYGPLYATAHASETAWQAFRSAYRPGKPFFYSTPPPNEEELVAWRLWMVEVFMPLNLRLEKVIVDNGDLIMERQMPDCLLRLCAHVAAYKPVIKKWQAADYSEHMSLSPYPEDLLQYVESCYSTLKAKQSVLLGSLKLRAGA